MYEAYRIGELLFAIKTATDGTGGGSAYQAVGYLVHAGQLQTVALKDGSPFVSVGPAPWQARDKLLYRLDAHLGHRAVPERDFDPAGLAVRGTWRLPV